MSKISDIDDAVGFFLEAGMIEQMSRDEQHYVKILLVYAAEKALKQTLGFK